MQRINFIIVYKNGGTLSSSIDTEDTITDPKTQVENHLINIKFAMDMVEQVKIVDYS